MSRFGDLVEHRTKKADIQQAQSHTTNMTRQLKIGEKLLMIDTEGNHMHCETRKGVRHLMGHTSHGSDLTTPKCLHARSQALQRLITSLGNSLHQGIVCLMIQQM